ncbi:glycosyltransferase [Sphingobium aromaticiconvertens]|uniref:glycosyltransferase n=1 Tax=Sphingobium aromaticiconvertens TaxID=365341 RepID=UPI003019A02B
MLRGTMPVENTGRTAVFTISSNNYMPYTRTLVNSSVAAHPDADHFLCLADTKVGAKNFYPEKCQILETRELEIPDFPGFAFRYDIMEMNTAAKPYMFLHLFDLGYDRVVYFDPDIKVYREITPVFEAFDAGARAVFTPHLTEPAETATPPDDITIMRAGIYNLGFAAFRRSEGVEEVLRWWARRLRYQCINAQDDGIFVDQKFMDLVPGFLPDVTILRNTTLNAAYWNLFQRHLEENGEEDWLVDGDPLIFFHFSGYDPRNSQQLSKHTAMFSENNGEALLSLLHDYKNDLKINGLYSTPKANYAYECFRSGAKIPTFVRHYFRNNHFTWNGDPFENFQDYLEQPSLGTAEAPDGLICTNLMHALWQTSDYLRMTYDPATAAGVTGLAEWFVRHSHRSGIDPRLTHAIIERVSNARRWKRDNRPPASQPSSVDISVIGYLTTNTGVGEVGRLTLKSLAGSGRRIDGMDIDLNVASSRTNMEVESFMSDKASGRLHIFNVNADQLPLVQSAYNDRLGAGAYRVAMPFWELADFPDPWISSFDHVDEIWAPSRFIQSGLVMKTKKPVIHMPVALDFTINQIFDRKSLGLPEERFIFLFSFDFLSFRSRKNPEAVIAAFSAAFKGASYRDHVSLVIKCVNSHHVPDELRRIREAIDSSLDVHILEAELTRTEMLGLVQAADCVVSLHRSEGLGLLIAEAMALGTPVIATDYSATTDLVTADTGYPVEYKLKDLKAGDYPFATGQVWADPDISHAAWQMRKAVDDAGNNDEMLERARASIIANHGTEAVIRAQERRLQELGL